MNKLTNDELILIIIQMKKNYENQYKKLEKKFNSLKTYLNEEDKILLYYDTCNHCDNAIYKIFDSEEGCCESNFRECYTCDKRNCMNCFVENKLEQINGNYYCEECNNFKTKMNEIK